MPKLKCSLLQDYARSRVTTEEDEEEEDLLVPEKRLNLLMASPSITKRRTSMMPVDSLVIGQTQNTTQPKLQDQEGSGRKVAAIAGRISGCGTSPDRAVADQQGEGAIERPESFLRAHRRQLEVGDRAAEAMCSDAP